MSGSEVSRRPPRFDVTLAAIFGIAGLAELQSSWAFERVPLDGPEWIHYVAVVGSSVMLAWRRLLPLYVAPAIAALVLSQPLVSEIPNTYSEVLTLALATYGVTAYGRGRGIAVSIIALLVVSYLLGLTDSEDPIGTAVTSCIVTLVVLAVGAVVRRTRERADRMEVERDLADERAAAVAVEERERIARELHDVVAHGMSVVVLQARGGRRMLGSDPERATRAFDDIERVASRCLDEMRRLVGILRAQDDAPLAPQPRLHEVPGLVDQARQSGAVVDLAVNGPERELAPALELTAYRIVQEAITNAIKHAPGSRVSVTLDHTPDSLTVKVDDDGPGPSGAASNGHGLIGMRERVELFGGTFSAGRGTSGGFGVYAVLPTTGAST